MSSRILSLNALPAATGQPNESAPRSTQSLYRQLVGGIDSVIVGDLQYATDMLVQDARILEALELDALNQSVSIGTILSSSVWSTQTTAGDAMIGVGLLFLHSVQQYCWVTTRSNMRDSIDDVDVDQMRRIFRRRLPLDIEEIEAGGELDESAKSIYTVTSQAARWFMLAHEFAHIRNGDVILGADRLGAEHRHRETAADRFAIQVTATAVKRVFPTFDPTLVTALSAVFVLESLRLLFDAHPKMRELEADNVSTLASHGPSQDRRGYVVGLSYPLDTPPHREIRRAMTLSHRVRTTQPVPDPTVVASFAELARSFSSEDVVRYNSWWRVSDDGTMFCEVSAILDFARHSAARCEVFLAYFALQSNLHLGKEQFRSTLAFLYCGYCGAQDNRADQFANLLAAVVYDFDELVALRLKDIATPGVWQPHVDGYQASEGGPEKLNAKS